MTTTRTAITGLWIALVVSGGLCMGQDERELMDLRGLWRFEIGDDQRWASPKFDDSRWARVMVPAKWEDEGFPAYDGYAWYRNTIQVPAGWEGRVLLLKLGHIDDVDEVYINGKFVAFTGLFPPTYVTAYGTPRSYVLPPSALKYGTDNTIAVRVYDSQLGGGIVSGPVAIYEVRNALQPDQPLAGPWKFSPGDDLRRSEPRYDDSGWETVEVPAYWETQGFKGMDGFGWYRTTFTVDPSLAGQRPILLLGMIDDGDETFVDGKRIGGTGSLSEGNRIRLKGNEYRMLRAYTLPSEVAYGAGTHTLAIRVFDMQPDRKSVV